MVEHLHQNVRSIRNRHGTCQTRRLRKTPRQIGMGGRSAVAQGAARHQTARDSSCGEIVPVDRPGLSFRNYSTATYKGNWVVVSEKGEVPGPREKPES